MASTPVKENKKATPTEVKAFARNLRIAPRKLRLVAGLVRGMHANAALVQLDFTNKKGSSMVGKLVKSAIANAEHNFNMKAEDMFIKVINVDMGTAMKRYFPRARGSAFVIQRKLSHLNLILEERKGKAPKARFTLPAKPTTDAKEAKVSEASTAEIEKQPKAKPDVIKTNESVKMNKVQNKRRLFNRKSGE